MLKINAAGSGLLYLTFLGSSGDLDYGNGIAVDEAGSAYVTGQTTKDDFPANHDPVSNATVTGSWSNGASGTSTCTTEGSGRCTVSQSIKPVFSSVTFTVTNVAKSGFAYAPAANHDPDGDSNGTSIAVSK